MRLGTKNTPENILDSTDPIASQCFSVRPEDMHFLLDLLANLYSDPIRAAVREYMSNARDAHREIDTPERPIEISLPTTINPQIEIKDFGPGICPTRMGNTFINFGASTKRRSNLQGGAFGLGCKSGFAVSETFTVVTIYRGWKRTYTASKSLHRMDLVREEKTEEPSGTTIIIPVKEGDMRTFTQAVYDVSEFWDVRPIIHNKYATIDWPPPKDFLVESKEDQWALESFSVDWRIQAAVVLDGIYYPISKSINSDNRFEDNDPLLKLLNTPLVLYFGIGSLSLAPSRDTLLFDDKTKTAIMRRLQKVSAGIQKHVIENIERRPSLKEAEVYWHNFCTNLDFLPINNNPPSWNGIKLKGTYRVVPDNQLNETVIRHFFIETGSRSDKDKMVTKRLHSITLADDAMIIWNDTDRVRGFNSAIENIIKEEDINDVYFIDFKTNAAKRFWFDEFNLDKLDVVEASSLDIKRKSRKPYERKDNIDCWVFDPNYYGDKDHERYWRPASVTKFFDSGIYIASKNKLAKQFDAGKLRVGSSQTIAEIISVAEIKDNVYLVPRRLVKHLGPLWKPLDSVAVPIIQQKLKHISVEALNKYREARSCGFSNSINYDVISSVREAIKNGEIAPDNCLAKFYYASVLLENKIGELSDKANLHASFAYLSSTNSVNDSAVDTELVNSVKNLYEEVVKTYPLLRRDRLQTLNKAIIAEYVSATDAFKQNAQPDSATNVASANKHEDPEYYCEAV